MIRSVIQQISDSLCCKLSDTSFIKIPYLTQLDVQDNSLSDCKNCTVNALVRHRLDPFIDSNILVKKSKLNNHELQMQKNSPRAGILF